MREGSFPGSQDARAAGPSGVHYTLVCAEQQSHPICCHSPPPLVSTPPGAARLICSPSIDPGGKSPLAAAPPASSSSSSSCTQEPGGLIRGEQHLRVAGMKGAELLPGPTPHQRDTLLAYGASSVPLIRGCFQALSPLHSAY